MRRPCGTRPFQRQRLSSAPPITVAPKIWYEAIAHPAVSGVTGRLADARLPGPVIRGMVSAFCAAFDVDMTQAVVPEGGFRTFNEFFTRALRPEARPVDGDPSVIVSPADSRVAAGGAIGPDERLEAIKGRDYALADLIADDSQATEMVGGFYTTLYLSPRDYHRVHSPCTGRVRDVYQIPGRLYPVMPAALATIDGLLARNARTVIALDTPHWGRVFVVMVGATNVARIRVSAKPGDELRRGDELGSFNLGSTVVLLVQYPGLALAEQSPLGQITQVGRALLKRH